MQLQHEDSPVKLLWLENGGTSIIFELRKVKHVLVTHVTACLQLVT